MAKKSKVKGSVFERLVAKMIITAAGPGFDRSDCYRTPLSGGHEFAGASDLVISPRLRKLFPFCVECKHRRNFRLEHVFDLVKDFAGYHAQVLAACEREGYCRQPMIVVRGNGGSIYAALTKAALLEFAPFIAETPRPFITYKYEAVWWVLLRFEDLLQALPGPEEVTTAVA